MWKGAHFRCTFSKVFKHYLPSPLKVLDLSQTANHVPTYLPTVFSQAYYFLGIILLFLLKEFIFKGGHVWTFYMNPTWLRLESWGVSGCRQWQLLKVSQTSWARNWIGLVPALLSGICWLCHHTGQQTQLRGWSTTDCQPGIHRPTSRHLSTPSSR